MARKVASFHCMLLPIPRPQGLCRAIETIYVICELKSSVVHVEHAARVFKEACEDFSFLKDRVKNQLLFEAYVQVRPCYPEDIFQQYHAATLNSNAMETSKRTIADVPE
jgi:hypothetical protein